MNLVQMKQKQNSRGHSFEKTKETYEEKKKTRHSCRAIEKDIIEI